ncbi:TniB family NTP-binding protein, partial [Streptomyces sp. NPDC013313]|uniref:TniB family NTP-binding protein n=2 Tax=unclassified Streptomyces TaxID=2593676 RepID=UPI0033CD788D
MTIALIRQHLQDLAPLGNVALSRKEGWREFADAPSLVAPEVLTRRQLRALTADDAEVYNHFRQLWHANLGPIRTPQLTTLHEQLSTVVDSNLQFGDKAKGAVAIDAYPGLGKTTSVLAFAKDFHRREIRIKGTHTRDGHQRWPVCRVGLTGNTGLKEFNRAMLEFYAHPGNTRGTSADLSRRALDCVTSCETRLLVVDDLHFLRVHATSGVEISNHFKYIANEFPVTVVFIGVRLAERGLFAEAQTARRTTLVGMRPFEGRRGDRDSRRGDRGRGHTGSVRYRRRRRVAAVAGARRSAAGPTGRRRRHGRLGQRHQHEIGGHPGRRVAATIRPRRRSAAIPQRRPRPEPPVGERHRGGRRRPPHPDPALAAMVAAVHGDPVQFGAGPPGPVDGTTAGGHHAHRRRGRRS